MRLLVFSLICYVHCFCQTATIIKENIDEFIGVDIYENIYYTQNNTLYKNNIQNNYCNVQYGTPDQIDISNPFQILVFYQSFNQIILLDNQLNYISEFNTPIGVTLIANAGKDKIWTYNNLDSILELYNYKTQKTEANSLPTITGVQNLKSDLNYAFVLKQDQTLETYNFIARKTNKINTSGKLLPISLNPSFYYKDNKIFTDNNSIFVTTSPVKSFDVINNSCYYLTENNIYHTYIPKK